MFGPSPANKLEDTHMVHMHPGNVAQAHVAKTLASFPEFTKFDDARLSKEQHELIDSMPSAKARIAAKGFVLSLQFETNQKEKKNFFLLAFLLDKKFVSKVPKVVTHAIDEEADSLLDPLSKRPVLTEEERVHMHGLPTRTNWRLFEDRLSEKEVRPRTCVKISKLIKKKTCFFPLACKQTRFH